MTKLLVSTNSIGDKFYYIQDNILHREDGPAIEYADGSKVWFQNDQIHRIDGPAYEDMDGEKAWYYQGQMIDCSSQEEFEKILKMKVFW